RRPQAARDRRDYVLNRMSADGFIALTAAAVEMSKPVTVRPSSRADVARADYFVEEVRRELQDSYGDKGLYGGGLSVRTTLNSRLQRIADSALRNGLSAYDRRHGWRGPLGKVDLAKDWRKELAKVALPSDVVEWKTAVVTGVGAGEVALGFADNTTGTIPFAEMRWARPVNKKGERGPAIKRPSDVLAEGDVVAVEAVTRKNKDENWPENTYGLRQVP
ncbi:unnamed protein product, partial [Laminaria digitata]